jgi:hypothetical protein
MRVSISSVLDAGPSVATILVLRMVKNFFHIEQ